MAESNKIKELEKSKEGKQQIRRSSLLTASGIMTVIASFLTFLFGIVYLFNGVQLASLYFGWFELWSPKIVVGISGMIGFSFGFMSSILIFKKSNKSLALLGMCFLLASSITPIAIRESMLGNFIIYGMPNFILYGMPVLILSIISLLLFIAENKQPAHFNLITKHTAFPIVSGVLSTIASIILLVLSVFPFVSYLYGHTLYVVGICGTIAFSFGLTAGILNLKRKAFPIAIIGIIFMYVASFIMTVVLPLGIVLTLPASMLAMLGIIFCFASRKEFA